MESGNIEKLLEKYFEATTTVAEEETLRHYFLRESVATHLEKYTPMFNHFTKAKEETFTEQIPLRTKSMFNYKWASVAAVGVLMLGLYFGKDHYDGRQLEKQQAVYAYNETKKAFDLLAENFGRGTQKVAYLNEFEEAKQKIYNND